MTQDAPDPVASLPARKPTREDEYYLALAYQEPVESIARLEEAGKFLLTTVTPTAGLFVAVFTLYLGEGNTAAAAWRWQLPFALWGLSMLCYLLVLLPRPYRAGRNEPAAWKAVFVRARLHKYLFLVLGTVWWGAFTFSRSGNGQCFVKTPIGRAPMDPPRRGLQVDRVRHRTRRPPPNHP